MPNVQLATLSVAVLLDGSEELNIASSTNLQDLRFWQQVLSELAVLQRVDLELARARQETAGVDASEPHDHEQPE